VSQGAESNEGCVEGGLVSNADLHVGGDLPFVSDKTAILWWSQWQEAAWCNVAHVSSRQVSCELAVDGRIVDLGKRLAFHLQSDASVRCALPSCAL
jgi:hypothetical protein